MKLICSYCHKQIAFGMGIDKADGSNMLVVRSWKISDCLYSSIRYSPRSAQVLVGVAIMMFVGSCITDLFSL